MRGEDTQARAAAGTVGRARRTARGAARSICLIGALSGAATMASTLVPGPEGLDIFAVRVVAVVTAGLSGLLVLLPWQRLPLPATLAFVPIGLTLIGFHNYFSAEDAYRYGAFFLVVFVWVGLWHPRGTALAAAPFAALAYSLPLALGEAPQHAPWTVTYALPLYVVVGEVIAWRSQRLDVALTRLEELARTDPLTGLANRTVLEQAMASDDPRYATGALIYLDVDDFKAVNDRIGHAGGDRVLEGVADALRRSVRPDDLPVRVAGDEFAVLLAGPVTGAEVRGIADRLAGRLLSLYVDGMRVSTSIGVAWREDHGIDELLVQADAAMYRAKDAGKATLVLATEHG